ncbi:alpha/beta hydrolase [Daejeonella lutea]|uniref:Phospholipase/carboxylesterase n=1 Tax=Daejeonella lutea TaxID=572036 RepID=A0A1T5BE76_9SPHI|nr:dienelactone hydrolase family protein [Daejeonella lutea]SKB45377.1 phospholipase/carboxylesterase [Daejeonella lutea]
MYQHSKQILTSGLPLAEAEKAIIMLHGRGATAESIMSLKDELHLAGAAVIAPQATNHSWYPYSFLVTVEQNQPALDSALGLIDDLVKDALAAGIPLNKIYFLGFSQGACLALEYIARHAEGYGGVIAYTGGLIGDQLNSEKYTGDLAGTPVLITTGNPDPHVPLVRVEQTVNMLKNLNASVTLKVYNGRSHTIQNEELQLANDLVLK